MIAEVFIFLLCIQYLYIVFMNESSEAQVMQQIRLIPRWNSSVKKGDFMQTGHLQKTCSVKREHLIHEDNL